MTFEFCRRVVLLVLLGLAATGAFPEEGRKAKSEVKPVFPELAKRMNLSGVVKVQIEIAPNGTVTSAKALGGPPVFIESALDAVKKWRYEPTPSATTQTVEFRFNPVQ